MKPKEFEDFWKEEADKIKEANQKKQGEKVQNKGFAPNRAITRDSQLGNKGLIKLYM